MGRKKYSSLYNPSYSQIYREIAKTYRDAAKLYEPPRKRVVRRDFSKRTQDAVLMQQNYQCKKCWNFLRFPEFDHIDGDPSNNDYSNCQALCPNCHAEKTRTPIQYTWQNFNWILIKGEIFRDKY